MRTNTNERGEILAALSAFAHQRPRLEFGNYGDRAVYRSEGRRITAQLHDARRLLRAVEMCGSISSADLKEGFSAYSGRLSWNGKWLDYCTGQYWPTEYRAAVCAVLEQAIRSGIIANAPEPTLHHNTETGELVQRYRGDRLNDYVRKQARLKLGRAIAGRFFN